MSSRLVGALFVEAAAGVGVEVHAVDPLEIRDHLERPFAIGACRHLAFVAFYGFERVEHDLLEQLTQGHAAVLRQALEDLDHALFHPHAELHAPRLRASASRPQVPSPASRPGGSSCWAGRAGCAGLSSGWSGGIRGSHQVPRPCWRRSRLDRGHLCRDRVGVPEYREHQVLDPDVAVSASQRFGVLEDVAIPGSRRQLSMSRSSVAPRRRSERAERASRSPGANGREPGIPARSERRINR